MDFCELVPVLFFLARLGPARGVSLAGGLFLAVPLVEEDVDGIANVLKLLLGPGSEILMKVPPQVS